jgi:predicted membrane channel-forming protein YqfA (hemolysin III family)
MGHNGVVDVVVGVGGVTGVAGVVAAVAQDSTDEDFGLQAGPYAFFFFVAMGLALVFLLLSMRKQMRRVRFDERGTTDAERMLGATSPDEPTREQ